MFYIDLGRVHSLITFRLCIYRISSMTNLYDDKTDLYDDMTGLYDVMTDLYGDMTGLYVSMTCMSVGSMGCV